jgi:hypothetical protein
MVLVRPKAAWLETGVLALCVAVAFFYPKAISAWFRPVERQLERIARMPRVSILLVGVLAIAGRAALLPWYPIPVPQVHDEFSYLLAADTFSSGRLANPTHPLWKHFETFHIDQQPTYMSMYPPAQGLVLAAGQWIAGLPWLGVLFSTGLMCSCLCWALQGWLPARWALLGGIFAVLRLGLFTYFVNSYWGGSVAAAGGALVLGALPRLVRAWRASHAAILACGLATLANSRPFEGALLGAAALAFLVLVCCSASDEMWGRPLACGGLSAWLSARPLPGLGAPRRVRERAWKIAPPALLILALTAGAMAYYNARVFGGLLVMPYHVNRATYAVVPFFFWQSLAPEPHYNHAEVRHFYLGWELDEYTQAHSFRGFLGQLNYKAFLSWLFYFGPLFTPPWLVLPWLFKDRRIGALALCGLVAAAGMSLNIFYKPQYAAPFTALFLLLGIQGLRYVQCWKWRGRDAGRALVRLTLPACVAVVLVVAATPALWTQWALNFPWYYLHPNVTPRQQLIAELSAIPGKHLAIVRYGPRYNPSEELVFNSADIDRSRIVWARDLGDGGNRPLLDYFKDRRAWRVDARTAIPQLVPYRADSN